MFRSVILIALKIYAICELSYISKLTCIDLCNLADIQGASRFSRVFSLIDSADSQGFHLLARCTFPATQLTEVPSKS